MKNNKNKGQSLVELVFAVGIIILVVTGMIVLLINTMGAKSKGFDRKKAVQMAEIIMEDLVSQKKNDADNFWLLNSKETSDFDGLDDQFPGYICDVDFVNVFNDSDYPNCGIGKTDCAEATITIEWQGKEPQSIIFNRFFTKSE